MLRVRRTRVPDVVESVPRRVHRVRPSLPVVATEGRVRRVRPMVKGMWGAEEPRGKDARPRFLIDWSKGLGYKLQIYLVSSYLYYNLNRSVITDHEFDQLCKELDAGWDTFEHQHKHCTCREDMVAGTGYANEYPLMVRTAAGSMLEHFAEL